MPSTPALVEYRCFVGIDIAATTFTATWSSNGTNSSMQPKALSFSQSTSGFAALQQQLQATGVAPVPPVPPVPPTQTLIGLEATGSYWIALAVTLHEAGYVGMS